MYEELKQQLPGVKENEPLAPYTTFKIGGPAKYFFVAQSGEEMVRALRAADECGVRFFVLAGGSNILVSDQGFDGLVILNAIKRFHAELRDGRAIVTAGAGESWDKIVEYCVAQNWAGIECLSGIPGTVGAAPVQNIGAYGQSVGEVVESVEAVDVGVPPLGGGAPPPRGGTVIFNREQCEFGYRTSIFKKARGRYSITRVTLALKVGGTPLVAYHDLKEYFADKNNVGPGLVSGRGGAQGPALQEVRQAVIEIRGRKGYLIMPGYECYQTAGSFFLNPEITREHLEKILPLTQGCPAPWYWLLENGRVKVSAACLLQSAGFSKGYRKGEVGISPKHPLSIANFGNATARDVIALAQEIKTAVQEKFRVALDEEVQLVGF